jgi:hypothetical protein
MKKLLFLVLCVLGFYTVDAQVTFKPGFRAGLNFSHFTEGDNYYNNYYYDTNGNYIPYESTDNFSSITDFYVGFFGALKLTKFYTLQPEIDYSRQGSNYEYFDTNIQRNVSRKLQVSYMSVGIVNKFNFNKFNFHVGPTIDFVVEKKNFNSNYDNYLENEVDLAFLLGAGYNFNDNFGIEARIKKGIVPVFDNYDSHTNVVFSVGATYAFDVK